MHKKFDQLMFHVISNIIALTSALDSPAPMTIVTGWATVAYRFQLFDPLRSVSLLYERVPKYESPSHISSFSLRHTLAKIDHISVPSISVTKNVRLAGLTMSSVSSLPLTQATALIFLGRLVDSDMSPRG